jgi:hypothetical protein
VVARKDVTSRSPATRPPARRTELHHALLAVISALGAVGLTGGGCGTKAIGIEACRDIEKARCEAAQYCGRIDDVDACRRYYQNHCLHGLAKGVEAPPDDVVAECVSTIEKAGNCAKGDRFASLEDCEPEVSQDPRGATRACHIVLYPEFATECSFLGKMGDLPPFGGQGGTSAGGGGQGGAP